MSKNVAIENAILAFKNFAGKEGKWNPEGNRNFCILLNDDIADSLKEDGWNVKYLSPKDENESPQPYIKVSVRYDKIPPKIIVITSRGKSQLKEEEVNMLDWADIEYVDLIITPYFWNKNKETGIKAYLKSMYVTLTEDEFEKKYYDSPDSSESCIGGCGHCEVCTGKCHNHGN